MKKVAGIICLVSDLDKSVEFYRALGCEISKRNPGISAHVCLNEFWIELLQKEKVVTEEFKDDSTIGRKGAGQYLHIHVEDVDKVYNEFIAKNLQPSIKPADFPWGHREFVVADPDGYKIVFFKKIA